MTDSVNVRHQKGGSGSEDGGHHGCSVSELGLRQVETGPYNVSKAADENQQDTHTHTHTHPFNGPLSGTTCMGEPVPER